MESKNIISGQHLSVVMESTAQPLNPVRAAADGWSVLDDLPQISNASNICQNPCWKVIELLIEMRTLKKMDEIKPFYDFKLAGHNKERQRAAYDPQVVVCPPLLETIWLTANCSNDQYSNKKLCKISFFFFFF